MKAPQQRQRYIAAGGLALLVALAAVIGSVDSIISFRVCFGVLLIIFSVAQFNLAINLYQHRNDLLLELFQPVGLSLFVAAGAIATLTSFLIALPEYDASCALRQPIILTCISFMGNILIARAWRIGCIISPTAVFAVASDEIDGIRMMRMKVMNYLSTLSGWGRFVGSCGRAKRGNNATRTMRITITFADSIRVAMMLLVPQLVLQIINLSVPNVRMQSIELTEGIHVCESGAGVSILIVGIVLAAIPFFVALLINIRSEGIPDRFRELKDILKSTSTSFCVILITLPTAGMIRMMVPTAHAYLLSASVLSFVLPLSYYIAQTRANVIKSTDIAKGSARSAVKKRKKVTRSVSSSSSSYRVSSSSSSYEEEDNLLILEAAEEAVTMGKMFDAMGSKSKAVDINEDILTLFKEEEDFSWEVGFTLSEVRSLGPKSLEIVVTTLIASSKLFWAMFRSNPENGEQAKTRTFKSCMDALDIFEKAPAKKQLRDHSIIFPGYSFMNEIAKAMPYKPPNNLPQDEFEKGLADNFLRATNHQQYHHCIALAMQADVMRRQGKHKETIVVIEEMKSIYDPGLHSRAILKEYVKDHCCETIAVITYWLSQDGRIEEAMKLCDDVIEALPEMKGTGAVQSKYFALLPICRVMTEQGQAKKALDLYRDTVEEPAAKGGRKMYPLVVATSPAIMITLNCASSEGGEPYADSKSDTAFMLNGERKYPAFFDYIGIIYFDMAFATLYAEACVCLASIHGCCSQDKKALIKECEQYLEASEEALKNKDGKLLSTVAHSYHSKIATKLQMLQSPSTNVQTLEKAGSDQAEESYDSVQSEIDMNRNRR